MTEPRLRAQDFDFELPDALIAQRPTPERSGSRLLVLGDESPSDILAFRDLPTQLCAGDLLVFNNTRVIPARLLGHKASGGAIEILVEEIVEDHIAVGRARSSKPLRPDGIVDFGTGGEARCIARQGEQWRLEFVRPVREVLYAVGRIPLPPYVTRADDAADEERYQTIFSEHEGAIAAPTAALHFDEPLMARIAAMGVQTTFITLHVGAGTFLPMRTDDPREHKMHEERVEVSSSAVADIQAARSAGRRIVAVGTTAVRALESASAGGQLQPFSGRTDLFIMPGFEFHTVDALITNFHLPRSTLLMLVSALAGRERILGAYAEAVAAKMRFFSYGDSMFIPKRFVS